MAESKEAQVEQVEDVKRWTAKRKSAVVLDLIKGKATAIDVARNRGRDQGLGAALPGWRRDPPAKSVVQQSGAHYKKSNGKSVVGIFATSRENSPGD